MAFGFLDSELWRGSRKCYRLNFVSISPSLTNWLSFSRTLAHRQVVRGCVHMVCRCVDGQARNWREFDSDSKKKGNQKKSTRFCVCIECGEATGCGRGTLHCTAGMDRGRHRGCTVFWDAGHVGQDSLLINRRPNGYLGWWLLRCEHWAHGGKEIMTCRE